MATFLEWLRSLSKPTVKPTPAPAPSPVPTPAPTSATATTVYIDPSEPTNGNGTQAKPFNVWPSLKAGIAYRQKGGTIYKAALSVSTVATEARLIVIGSYGDGKAIIEGPVILQGAAYVTVDGIEIRKSPYGGVTFKQGAHHCAVKNSYIHHCKAGVWIGDGAGGNNLVSGNAIEDNEGNGIAVDKVNLTPQTRSVLQGNSIKRNGGHGIELSGNYYDVTRNIIEGNGRVIPGTSAVHCYAGGFQGSSFFDAGSYNFISENVCTGQRCPNYDGNGIQSDQKTHHNEVRGNLCFKNDGAGVVLFDAYSNTVVDNVCFSNSVDTSKSHPIKGELVLHADLDSTYANVATNNVLAGAPSLTVTPSVRKPNDTKSAATPLSVKSGTTPHFYTFPAGSMAGGRAVAGWNPGVGLIGA